MNDLSRLTYSTLLARMRPDLFSQNSANRSAQIEKPDRLEKCDRCGLVLPMLRVTFDGQEFLCPKCEPRKRASPP